MPYLMPQNINQACQWLSKGIAQPLYRLDDNGHQTLVGIRKATLWERFTVKFMSSTNLANHYNRCAAAYAVYTQSLVSLRPTVIRPQTEALKALFDDGFAKKLHANHYPMVQNSQIMVHEPQFAEITPGRFADTRYVYRPVSELPTARKVVASQLFKGIQQQKNVASESTPLNKSGWIAKRGEFYETDHQHHTKKTTTIEGTCSSIPTSASEIAPTDFPEQYIHKVPQFTPDGIYVNTIGEKWTLQQVETNKLGEEYGSYINEKGETTQFRLSQMTFMPSNLIIESSHATRVYALMQLKGDTAPRWYARAFDQKHKPVGVITSTQRNHEILDNKVKQGWIPTACPFEFVYEDRQAKKVQIANQGSVVTEQNQEVEEATLPAKTHKEFATRAQGYDAEFILRLETLRAHSIAMKTANYDNLTRATAHGLSARQKADIDARVEDIFTRYRAHSRNETDLHEALQQAKAAFYDATFLDYDAVSRQTDARQSMIDAYLQTNNPGLDDPTREEEEQAITAITELTDRILEIEERLEEQGEALSVEWQEVIGNSGEDEQEVSLHDLKREAKAHALSEILVTYKAEYRSAKQIEEKISDWLAIHNRKSMFAQMPPLDPEIARMMHAIPISEIHTYAAQISDNGHRFTPSKYSDDQWKTKIVQSFKTATVLAEARQLKDAADQEIETNEGLQTTEQVTVAQESFIALTGIGIDEFDQLNDVQKYIRIVDHRAMNMVREYHDANAADDQKVFDYTEEVKDIMRAIQALPANQSMKEEIKRLRRAYMGLENQVIEKNKRKEELAVYLRVAKNVQHTSYVARTLEECISAPPSNHAQALADVIGEFLAGPQTDSRRIAEFLATSEELEDSQTTESSMSIHDLEVSEEVEGAETEEESSNQSRTPSPVSKIGRV